ncbi:hypothetical protein MX350_004639, partial [Vibrio parahaemolyticus]|nr:hypothetical protein [Vibrio parahaemolyticus]
FWLRFVVNSLLRNKADQKFAITHATDANVINSNKTMTLFSRKKLEERNINFRSGLSTSRDVDELKNDDFVFFLHRAR